MQYRRLGSAGMKVSTIALGGWMNFGEGKVASDTARKVIEKAYEHGINFFDIADEYAKGEAERHLGELLSKFPRHTLVISSKVFWPMSDDVNDRGLSRKHIMESIDKSLKRIGTDYLDIYFCHRPDPETPLLETARAMNDLVQQGKILYWGTSEWSDVELAEVTALCERYNLYPPQTEQPNYSLIARERVEKRILPIAEPRGIGLVAFSPLGQGILTGKYDNGVPEGSRLHHEEWVKKGIGYDQNVERVRRLKPIADAMGITRSQLALAWVLRKTGVSSVITSATRVEQVLENVKAVDITFSSDVLSQIDEIFN
jgi:voltage-dependent potassium channel beta subunit